MVATMTRALLSISGQDLGERDVDARCAHALRGAAGYAVVAR
jgi:hypothetical protein